MPVSSLRHSSVEPDRELANVIGAPIDALSWSDAVQRIEHWGAERQSRVVFICNVHSVVTARLDHDFGQALKMADMATPDGAPVAWLMRKTGFHRQERINGPDLMWSLCERAAISGLKIYLYGGSDETLKILTERLGRVFPQLIIAGAYSPPYRKLTDEEDRQIVEKINASGAGVVWVGLGCPKQELWMTDHRGRIMAPMVGVGAAFDYHAGTIRRAPMWMQRRGLEWLYRLGAEPKRLWRRYLITNSLFISYAASQLVRRMFL